MPSRAAYAEKSYPQGGRHGNKGAATVFAAVIVGIYLGASTISEIDPFYRTGQTRSGNGSYTIDGWRGADAVRPPAAPAEAPMRNPGLAWSASSRPYPEYSIDSGPDPVAEYESGDANSEDRVMAGGDCPDCAEIMPIPVEPVPEAVPMPAGCASGDSACAPEDHDVASAPPADF